MTLVIEMKNMYENLRENLEEIIEYWEDDVRDEDVSELPKDGLKVAIKENDSFKLYRYMPPNYFNIRNIEAQTLHLSPNGVLNDVFEGMTETTDEIPHYKYEKLKDLAYMCCMTEKPDNILMWSHYAQKHEGVCVEYDLKLLGNEPFHILDHIFPVVYKDNRQYKRNFESLIKSLDELRESIVKQYEYEGEEALDDVLPLFLTKGKIWEYEKEWRIIYTKKQMYDINEEELYGCNLRFRCISAVYLGYRIHPEIRRNILEICERISTDRKKVSVYQSKIAKENYELSFDKLY